MISVKTSERIVKYLLFAILFITPLVFFDQLYFPFVSAKTYVFRLIIGVAFFFWTGLIAKSSIHRPRAKNILIAALLVFLVGYVITAFLGVDPLNSFFSSANREDGVIEFGVWIVYFLMLASVLRAKRDWQVVFGVFILTALISSVYGLIHIDSQLRIFGTFGNPSFLGAFLLFAVGFAALFLAKGFSPLKNPLGPKTLVPLACLGIFFAAMIVMTQTRGDYIGLLAGVLVFVALMHFFPGKSALLKKLIMAVDIAVITLVVFLGFILTHPNSQVVEGSHLLQRIANSVESNSVSERLAEWNMAVKGWEDRPVFGWGPENFGAVSNKYYNYRVGLIDSWFDRPHNQTLQILAEGGVTLFAGYLFVLGATITFLYRIFKKEPIVGSVIGATLAAYLAQDFFLFDTFATYIGFFTLLGFIYYLHERHPSPSETRNLEPRVKAQTKEFIQKQIDAKEIVIYVVTGLVALAFIWYTVWIPSHFNPLILQYNMAIDSGELKAADEILNTSLGAPSPYVIPDIPRAAGWELGVKYLFYSQIKEQDKPVVLLMYKKITSALTDLSLKHPYEAQMYFLLGSLYRTGFEQLGQAGDLAKSEEILKKSLMYSPYRIEYIDALSQTLLDEKKMDELDALVQKFIAQISPEDSYRYLTLGNYYYLLGKYDQAFQQYVEAQNRGYTFVDTVVDRDYDRYLEAAQATRNFEKAVALINLHLEKKGPSAVNYFNLAVAYAKLKKMDEARAAYGKAVELEPENYRQYEAFFK